jgi:hypothetical protein
MPLRFDRAEMAGAVADLGVLVPIAVALIVSNGLSATAVLLPAGLLYVAAGLYYRLPVPVQPLKAFGAIAIAQGLGVNEIAAGALLMGGVFVLLGLSGLLDRIAKIFPQPIIRGIQLSVGLLFCKLAWTLTTAPPQAFADHVLPVWWLVGGGLAVTVAGLLLHRQAVALILVVIASIAMLIAFQGRSRSGLPKSTSRNSAWGPLPPPPWRWSCRNCRSPSPIPAWRWPMRRGPISAAPPNACAPDAWRSVSASPICSQALSAACRFATGPAA